MKRYAYLIAAASIVNWLINWCLAALISVVSNIPQPSPVEFLTPGFTMVGLNLLWLKLDLSKTLDLKAGPERYIITCGHIAAGIYLYHQLPIETRQWIMFLMYFQALFFMNGAVGFMPSLVAALGAISTTLAWDLLTQETLPESYVILLFFSLNYAFIVSFFNQQARNEIRKRRKLQQKAEDDRQLVETLNKQIKEQVLVRYLPPALINDIFEGKVSMDTKPATQDITVLFSDLSGFTKMSEEQGAETVADFLNDYLSIMNETIFANNGTIDKFIGDAIMVLFGAPVPMTAKEQAENAARCARAMQAGMVLVNEKWKARGLNEVSMRIGIHQGTAVVGNFGSAQRVDYTAIGPSVNLASRIESACVPGEIFVSPEISELLSPERTEQAGEYELKGISGKTSLYRLVGNS